MAARRAKSIHVWPEPPAKAACRVSIEYDVVAGRVEPVDVRIEMVGGQHFTTGLVRELPLGTWSQQDRRTHRELRELTARAVAGRNPPKREQDRNRSEYLAYEDGRPGRPRVPWEKLVEVAKVYREADATTGSPTKAVAEHFDAPRSTAAKWVQLTREVELLGSTEERQPGEISKRRRRRT